MAGHTPLPWTQYLNGSTIYGGNSFFVAIMQSKTPEADAAFIVTAVNSHDALVDAVKGLRLHLKLFCGPDDAIANAVFEIADAALTQAGTL